ncbi:MAG: 30S ribosomal protein S12 methylthiotransferase RimO [Firmicutes bacterium]|nr:30S ribosomal protein S12 methylthiotransferase RimO [Bacillota bacterium]
MPKEAVVIVSLGCSKNLVDSEVMAGILAKRGYGLVSSVEEADIAIINTCGFIESAKQESVDTVLEIADRGKRSGLSVLIVAGCLGQRYAAELLKSMPEINAVVGTGEFPRIDEIVERALAGERVVAVGHPEYLYDHDSPRIMSTPKHYAYLKIADGCDNRCSYCAIPQIRGCLRSRRIESVQTEAEALAAAGCRELILIAQDTTAYGVDLYGRPMLPELIRSLCRVDGIEWIRLLYTYPTRITDDLIDVIIEQPKVARYLDIPLQHVSGRILQAMGRAGDAASLSRLFGRIRERIPDITLRTSLIVGFPGETDEEFSELMQFVEDQKIDRVGVFMYSREEGTAAASLDGQIPERLKKRRYAEIMELQKSISLEKMRARIGSVERVLVDGVSEECEWVAVGRSQREAPEVDGLIYIENERPDQGAFVDVRITNASDYDLVGEIVSSA